MSSKPREIRKNTNFICGMLANQNNFSSCRLMRLLNTFQSIEAKESGKMCESPSHHLWNFANCKETLGITSKVCDEPGYHFGMNDDMSRQASTSLDTEYTLTIEDASLRYEHA